MQAGIVNNINNCANWPLLDLLKYFPDLEEEIYLKVIDSIERHEISDVSAQIIGIKSAARISEIILL